MQTRKVIIAIAIILMLSMLTQSTFAWVYHNNPIDDGIVERFGPRADRLLIKLYADDNAEFDALVAGDIDLTDWPIPKTRYAEWTTAPLNGSIQVVSYGPEYGLYILDMNSNNNPTLGNPPDGVTANPVYETGPSGSGNPTSSVGLRRAIAYLVNRGEYLADPSIGAGFGFPMYTTMPPAQEKYVLDVFGFAEMPWAYTYSRDAANALLDASGFAARDVDDHRIWNVTGNTVNLIFYIRSDHPGRNMIGTKLLAEFDAVGLKYTAKFGNSPFCSGPVMAEKNFHLYTAGWSLSVTPDHLILWAWDYYWHPGKPYNYSGHNDPEFNDAANGIMYANTQEEAVAMALIAQYRQSYLVLSCPLYCVAGNKAYHKTYVGNDVGEENYFGKNWRGVKNMLGYGIDNGWSLTNMWPEQAEVEGNGAMTIRWGFKAVEILEWNPIYSQWLFDWNAMNPLYASLLTRNPDNMGEFWGDVAKSWTVSTYMNPDPALGECTKIRFQLRDDVYWSDGHKLDIEDIYFTFKELKDILAGRGLPNPWWQSNVGDIVGFSMIDPCTFEVLLKVKSYWALSWIGGNIILPEHIWRTIAETGDPQATSFDLTRMTGNGPWKAVSYGGIGSTVLHEKNPLYYNILPVDVEVLAKGETLSPQIIEPGTSGAMGILAGGAWFEVKTASNWYLSNLIVDKDIYFSNKTAGTLTLVKSVNGITLVKGVPHVENVTLAEIAAALGVPLTGWPRCSYDIDVIVTIVGPPFVCPSLVEPQPNIWIGFSKEVVFDWHGTITEDINIDCYVNAKDAVILGNAFGAPIASFTWNARCDLKVDDYVNAKDAIKLGIKFGWPNI